MIILAIAHALLELIKDFRVYIVTLHPFLSLFGKTKYGEGNQYIT